VSDLKRARQRRHIQAPAAADERAALTWYREAFDHQQATNPGFPETIELGGRFSVKVLRGSQPSK
jgi:hypothetical protein